MEQNPWFLLAVVICAITYTNGRIFDAQSLARETVATQAGQNLTLACPGVTEHSLILSLEWLCQACHSHLSPSSHSSGTKLVQYRGETTTVWQNQGRVTLDADSYALHFHPVVAGDSGEYQCLVNNRPLPEAIIKLIVQDVPERPGRPLISSFTSRSVNISWAPPLNSHNSRIINFIIQTRIGEDGNWNETGILTGNDTSYQVLGLEPFTVYSFRVAARNGIGQGPFSKESYYFVTLREDLDFLYGDLGESRRRFSGSTNSFSLPEGKPIITSATNISSSQIRLTFKPPLKTTIHGEFIGYRLAFRPRDDRQSHHIQEIYLRDPSIQSYIIDNLMTFTQYLVSLQVFNPEGLGPSTTVAVITDEGGWQTCVCQEQQDQYLQQPEFVNFSVPTRPENVSLLWVTDSMMELSWLEPERPNGKLEGFRIYYMQNNFTDVVTTKQTLPHMKFTLENLKPFTEYKLWVKAFTWKNEGESSDTIEVKTDVGGPSPPRILNLSCLALDALFVQWQRPTKFYNTIDYYYVDYRSEEWLDFEEVVLPARRNHYGEESTILPNLTTNAMYEIRVRGGSRSVIEPEKVYKGQYSDSKKILLEPNCEKARLALNLPRASNEFTPTMVAISVCASFALVLLLIALIIWRRCFQGEYYYLDDPPRIPNHLNGLGWQGDSPDELKPTLPAHLFPAHVQQLHVDGDIGFSKEYEAIQATCVQEEFAAEFSQHPENKQKNRYLNIVAYDHSRVRLQALPGQKKCVEYVNANYIDGFRKAHAYIGTQGPLPSTFETFWRMVWEHNVHIIVMITNLVERGRKKCDLYWPSEGTETYGVIQVRFIKEEVMATYTVRTFTIRHTKLKKKKQTVCERTIYHYHYTNWPDHGTPSHPLPVLSFVKKSSAANPADGGPIIVHCSAGVGRTGTYIVLDTMLRQIRARGDLNVFSFLHHIRAQRNFLVQTEEQYIFIHDALVEGIESGETNVNKSYLSRYIHSLVSGTYADEKSEVSSQAERQYKLVTAFTPQEFHLSAALKPFNLTKNRNLDYVCTDAYRVLLTPKPGVEGSDYINATFLPGYHRLQEFVITQHPLESTISEFWQMLWDHNIQTVVILSAVDDQEYPTFWPSVGDDLDLETNCRVKLLQESDRVGFVLRDFAMQSLQDDYELQIKLIQSSHWPHHCSSPLVSVFDLIQLVQESFGESTQNGPIAVVDRFGGLEAATFCALTTLYKQLATEDHVDVYMYAKLYHEQRPGVWKSLDDYLLLYRCVESIAGSVKALNNGDVSGSPTAVTALPGVENLCCREEMETVNNRRSMSSASSVILNANGKVTVNHNGGAVCSPSEHGDLNHVITSPPAMTETAA